MRTLCYGCVTLAILAIGCSKPTTGERSAAVPPASPTPQSTSGAIRVEIMNANTIRLVRKSDEEGASTVVLEYQPDTGDVVFKLQLITDQGNSKEISQILNVDAEEKVYLRFDPLLALGSDASGQSGGADMTPPANVVWTPRVGGVGDASLEFDLDGDRRFEDSIHVPSVFERAAV